jgi:hypothetical protein
MGKNVRLYVSGAVSLLLFSIAINLAASLNLLFPSSVIEWIGASRNPRITLWVTSLLSASFIYVALQLGIKLPSIKAWVERPDHPVFNYLLGLPLGVVLSITAISSLALFLSAPVCESPIAIIQAASLNGGEVKYDGKVINAEPDARITLAAISQENSIVFCTWETTGTAIKSLNPRSSCKTQLSVSNQPGDRGIITLTLSKSYCSLRSTNPLEVLVIP